ncbi:hypothetical protein SAMN04488005_1911 [Yoonia tamlensis]|uniref:Uncharacterized protein n=1 Tax=Yoonia tamlensis TaxID=390270 RepID=A0A1I6GMX3_9RHOB|nr:hypothetical protein [Yoonia tamlensis]SFR43476.1 hypothetical protein SAMN04488005_1911 [Yoonia tamlensis]
MLGLIALLCFLICSGVWLLMLFSGNKSGLLLGRSFESFMFASVGCAVAAAILLRIGI